MSQAGARAKIVTVTDRNGLRGTIDTTQSSNGDRVLVRLENGEQVLVPKGDLILQNDGNFTLPFSLTESGDSPQGRDEKVSYGYRDDHTANKRQERRREDDRIVMPVVAETLDVQKRRVDTGGVRIKKIVHEREELVDEPLIREEVQVKRVPINRVVDEPVPVRHVGNTVIVSVLEELLVVEKRLMLKEELHITKGQVETYKPQRVTLRSEEAIIERVSDGGPQVDETNERPPQFDE